MKFDYPTPDQLTALKALWKQAFGDPDDFIDQFFCTGFGEARCRCAVENGQLTAALYWFDCELEGRRLAYLYAIATDKQFQNRGICHALMDDTHALLQAQGYSGTLLVPGATSLGAFYSAMGYRYATELREFFCAAAPEPIFLRPIDAQEYARLRVNWLPKGGVIQEGSSLAFLSAQANLYAGTHLLLAARRDGDTLYGLELLGDAAAAPGLLQALGASKGQFRAPGGSRPFAMYRPLDNAPAPAYFAFAFD